MPDTSSHAWQGAARVRRADPQDAMSPRHSPSPFSALSTHGAHETVGSAPAPPWCTTAVQRGKSQSCGTSPTIRTPEGMSPASTAPRPPHPAACTPCRVGGLLAAVTCLAAQPCKKCCAHDTAPLSVGAHACSSHKQTLAALHACAHAPRLPSFRNMLCADTEHFRKQAYVAERAPSFRPGLSTHTVAAGKHSQATTAPAAAAPRPMMARTPVSLTAANTVRVATCTPPAARPLGTTTEGFAAHTQHRAHSTVTIQRISAAPRCCRGWLSHYTTSVKAPNKHFWQKCYEGHKLWTHAPGPSPVRLAASCCQSRCRPAPGPRPGKPPAPAAACSHWSPPWPVSGSDVSADAALHHHTYV